MTYMLALDVQVHYIDRSSSPDFAGGNSKARSGCYWPPTSMKFLKLSLSHHYDETAYGVGAS